MYFLWFWTIPSVFKLPNLSCIKNVLIKAIYTSPFAYGIIGLILIGLALQIDISESKQMDKDLLNSMNDLHNAMSEVTKELHKQRQ